MSELQAERAVLLTPAGRGAVATILVEGPGATERVARYFRAANGRRLEEQSLGRIVFGRWTPSGEELVVCRRDADRLELHCHGGAAASDAVLEPLVAEGCRAMDWPTWLRGEEPDSIAAEARLALARANTARTAAILFDQYAGALRGEIVAAGELIQSSALRAAAERLQRLLHFAPLGLHLVEPWRVVLAGRPNVGKSSLINALVGYRRAIVFDRPGTTRDVVTAVTVLDGWPVELSDTAGLTASDDATEAAGVARARVGLAEADLVVLVFDASASPSVEDRELTRDWPDAIRVQNKCDLVDAAVSRDGGLPVSALTGEGLEPLRGRIRERLVPEVPAEGAAVPFCVTQVEAIRRAFAALAAGEAGQAAAELNGLLAQ